MARDTLVVLCCTLLYFVVLCCTLLYFVVLCCTLLYFVVLCCTLLYFVVLCCTLLYFVVLCCTLLYFVVLCCTLLYFVVLCCTLLCFAVLCCAVRCCALLCVAVRCCALMCHLVDLHPVLHSLPLPLPPAFGHNARHPLRPCRQCCPLLPGPSINFHSTPPFLRNNPFSKLRQILRPDNRNATSSCEPLGCVSVSHCSSILYRLMTLQPCELIKCCFSFELFVPINH